MPESNGVARFRRAWSRRIGAPIWARRPPRWPSCRISSSGATSSRIRETSHDPAVETHASRPRADRRRRRYWVTGCSGPIFGSPQTGVGRGGAIVGSAGGADNASVWADLILILWTAGLRVTAAWTIATDYQLAADAVPRRRGRRRRAGCAPSCRAGGPGRGPPLPRRARRRPLARRRRRRASSRGGGGERPCVNYGRRIRCQIGG